MHSLSVIVRYYRIFCEHKLADAGYDLGLPEQSVLLLIEAFGQSNQETIARHLMIDKGSITKTIAKLEAKHYIRRWENPDNKREKLLILNPESKAPLEKIAQTNVTWEKIVTNGVSADSLNCTDLAMSQHMKNAIAAISQIHEHSNFSKINQLKQE